eukprot:scaffold26293_cov112-Isochrysis_galbana.AAC.7
MGQTACAPSAWCSAPATPATVVALRRRTWRLPEEHRARGSSSSGCGRAGSQALHPARPSSRALCNDSPSEGLAHTSPQ